MTNKMIIGILVLLVLISGGLCYYSYMLSEQIYSLGEQFIVFQQEQATRIGAINDELTTLRGETLIKMGTLEGKIGQALDRIDTLQDEIDGTLVRVSNLEDEIGENLVRIDTLEDDLGNIAATVNMPSGGNAARLDTKRNAYLKLQNVFGVLGETSKTFMDQRVPKMGVEPIKPALGASASMSR